MRLLIAIVFLLLASCRNHHDAPVKFIRFIPDTSKTWAGRNTKDTYTRTRQLENFFKLQKLVDGTIQDEIRVWRLSGSYDPQVLFIAKADSLNNWTLRTVSFCRAKSDSISSDHSKVLRQSLIDSLAFHKYWQLTSQSDMLNGDNYGCMDGEDLFIELCSKTKYKFMWYRCPEINKEKDTAFLLAAALANRLDALAADY